MERSLSFLCRYACISTLVLTSANLNAQTNCLAQNQVSATLSTTDNRCGGDGSITVNLSNTENIRLYLYKDGINTPIVQTASANASHTFNNLQPGSYRVEARCNTDFSIIYFNQNASVGNSYVSITNANIETNVVCGNFRKEADIRITSVTGGTAPYTYSIIKSDNPAYDDALSRYQTSPDFKVNEYGRYQIRIKDNCGNIFTATRDISANNPPVKLVFRTEKNNCSVKKMVAQHILNATNDAKIELETQYPEGVKLQIRHNNANGKIIFDGIYTRRDQEFNIEPALVSGNAFPVYYYTTTTPCGVEFSYTSAQEDEIGNIAISSTPEGCYPNEKIKVKLSPSNSLAPPINVEIKNSQEDLVQSLTFETRGRKRVSIAYRLIFNKNHGRLWSRIRKKY
ncbi:MAG: hypothetical protein Q4A00_04270 [Flavobacteriaceae bacterium]|nr:hypothetical protein [Flavobacteriaceae bacterium]